MTDAAHGVSSAQVTKAGRSPDMPRRQKAPTPAHSNEALTLLTLQQQVFQLTAARATLDEVLELVHETPLCNLASAQDRRTLNTAQSCLESLRIRLEAHANTVEDTVRQKQVSLVLRQRQEAAVATELPTDVSAKHYPGLPLQTSTRSGPTAVDERGSVVNPRWILSGADVQSLRACVPAYLQIFPAPLRGSERGRIVSPPCHLSLCLTPWLVGVHHTVGCLPMCCPPIHCMAAFIAKIFYAWRASRRDLRDPGRGDPGFRRCWVDCFAGHLRKILLFDLVFCVCFCARSRNSEASSATPLELSGQGSLFWFVVWLVLFALVCFCFVLLCCFSAFPVFWARLDFGLFFFLGVWP